MLLWTFRLHFWEPGQKVRPKIWKNVSQFLFFFLVLLSTKTIFWDCPSAHAWASCFRVAPNTRNFILQARKQVYKKKLSQKSFLLPVISLLVVLNADLTILTKILAESLNIRNPIAVFEFSLKKFLLEIILWICILQFGSPVLIFWQKTSKFYRQFAKLSKEIQKSSQNNFASKYSSDL